jgi:hypothetical protein
VTSEPYDPIPPGSGEPENAPPIRDDVTLRDQLANVNDLLRSTIIDPEGRADLLQKRSEILATLAARREQREES